MAFRLCYIPMMVGVCEQFILRISLRRLGIVWVVGLAAWLLCADTGWADMIHLRNGGIIRGSIIRETQTGVIVRLGRNQQIHITYQEIAEVRRDGEAVPLGRAGGPRRSSTRDLDKEKALIRLYSRQLEFAYFQKHPGTVRVPYQVKREECDPVRLAKRYRLPAAEAKSNKELENIFELTLQCYKSGESSAWRRTLFLYGKTRDEYIAAISSDIDLANLYLDHPNLPYLLGLTDA